MPNIFKPKRSTTASSVPTTGNLSDGELAVNLADRKIFVRNGASIVTVASDLVDGDKGDITVSSSGATWTIDSGVVTNAKLANVSTATIKGRTTAGTGSPEDLTGTQATALLDTFTTSLKGLAPASGGGTSNFLRADGTWAAPVVSGNLNVGIVTATSFVKSGGTSSQFLKADGSVDSNTYITSASVGNGTLSLGVSGTGLSGTASFTANQSGNTTFTVTSNATSANTASTIVARDGSGNFIAGIITATTFSGALSGNATSATTATSATSATSAGSVTNSVTFNNAGTGAVSGTTFNGSAAQTISHNTIGASPLAGSTSLTTTGTVTTGTWSGSFGAVSGANLTNLTAGNLSGTIPSGVLGNSSLFVGTTSIALNRASASQSLTGVSIDGNAGTVTNGFYTTSSFNLGTTSIAVNRASAAQSLTGINIDGSSGSCTGNAATATILQTTRTIWGQNFNGSANVTGALSGATDITASGTVKGNQVIGGTGSVIGSAGLIVNGTTGDNDSQLIIKKPSQSSFGVLSWDGQVFLSANIYYDNGVWVHSAPSLNTNNNMLVLAPGTGVQWYASNNSTGSWNVAGGTTLWNDSGVWQRSLSNTLTLNTSGTGLSGSTTYNNSGAATFTVTSNATNANTANAIVSRDASGNFSAGTITATLSGNASTATTFSTGRTNYAGVTDGAVAGQLMWKNYGNNHTLFDASAGTSPQGGAVDRFTPANLVDSDTGQNTWGYSINLMGWNGTATYGVRVDYARASSRLFTTRTIWGQNFDGTGNVTGALTGVTNITASGTVNLSADQALVNQNNGNAAAWYGRILSKNSTSDKASFLGTYGSIAGVFAHNNALNAWADLYVNTVDGASGGTVRMPSTVLINGNQAIHAGNYNSYAPTLTGTGASGSWGISITGSSASCTGNAATATSATSAGSVTNSVTFNNGGAGAASGTTFNGSAAQTISYNTIGASPLAGSASLTTTGTVTSGTWSGSFGSVSGANLTNLTAGNLSGTIPSGVLGNSVHFIGTTSIALNRASAAQSLTGVNIDGSSGSCTGNAATATTLATARNIGGTSFNGSADITPFRANTIAVIDGGTLQASTATYAARTASSNPNQYTFGINWEFKNASVVGGSGNYAGLLTLAPYNGTTASTGDPNYQLAISPAGVNSTGIPTLQMRAGIDTTWGSWATILHSSSTLTAGNLSGTIPSAVLGNSSHFIGTTSIALNRGSGAQTLTGVSIDGNAGTVTNGFYTTSSFFLGTTSIAVNRASAAQSLTGINIDGSSGSCTGNAATATTLQTTRTIWGQNFNGSANVTGALTGVTDITATGNVAVDGAFRAESSNSTERFDIYYNETTDSLDFDYLTV